MRYFVRLQYGFAASDAVSMSLWLAKGVELVMAVFDRIVELPAAVRDKVHMARVYLTHDFECALKSETALDAARAKLERARETQVNAWRTVEKKAEDLLELQEQVLARAPQEVLEYEVVLVQAELTAASEAAVAAGIEKTPEVAKKLNQLLQNVKDAHRLADLRTKDLPLAEQAVKDAETAYTNAIVDFQDAKKSFEDATDSFNHFVEAQYKL